MPTHIRTVCVTDNLLLLTNLSIQCALVSRSDRTVAGVPVMSLNEFFAKVEGEEGLGLWKMERFSRPVIAGFLTWMRRVLRKGSAERQRPVPAYVHTVANPDLVAEDVREYVTEVKERH